MPRDLDQSGEIDGSIDNEYARAFREAIQVDTGGKEFGNTGRVVACSHCWATYSTVFLLEEAIERSGWRSKKDNAKLIETLEGMSMKQSFYFPQGDNIIRAADHQGFHQHWMSHIENGKLAVKFKIKAEEVMYDVPRDFRKEKL
jgi:branched-chain amino acid transport system substrate-binding protein